MHQVKDIMTERPVGVRPETTIDEAIELLLEHQVGGLPVVDERGKLLGVISEIDIIDLVYKADIEGSIVGDYMTRGALSLDAEASLDDAANIFCQNHLRRIPVVNEGRLVGIISRRDLIRFVRDVRKGTAALETAS